MARNPPAPSSAGRSDRHKTHNCSTGRSPDAGGPASGIETTVRPWGCRRLSLPANGRLYATVVVGKHHHRAVFQTGIEHPLTGDIEVIGVNQRKRGLSPLTTGWRGG